MRLLAWLVLGVLAVSHRAGSLVVKRSVDLNEQHKLESTCTCSGVRPTHYLLEIDPFFEPQRFSGRVAINITALERLTKFSLHVHPDLQISNSSAKLLSSPGDDQPQDLVIASTQANSRKSLYTFYLDRPIPENSSFLLELKYLGNLTINETSGVFMNDYMDVDGQKHYVVGTYLRLNNARRVFPCFDELQYKAKFRLILTRPKTMKTLSNTLADKTVLIPGKDSLVQDHFLETPEMATYQLGFVISDFEVLQPTKSVDVIHGSPKKLEITIWGRRDYLEALKDVPNKIVMVVNYLQNYFNSSIQMPKLDVIAMPLYTASNAADSWGILMFKESELSNQKVWNLAYELTYQWIGQMITPYRWMDASENKALNSFLASTITMDIAPDELNGEWPMNTIYSLYYGYGRVHEPSRTGIMRTVKFTKMELVFRMFYFLLGSDNFKTGIRQFIHQQLNSNQTGPDKAHGPRSFTQTDIYDSLNQVANLSHALPPSLSVNEVADTWIDQEHLPLVTVIRDYATGNITFSQKPYVRESKKDPPKWDNSYQWHIPLVIQSHNQWNISDFRPKVWLLKAKERQNLTVKDFDDKDHFVIVNPEEIGLFHVNYDEHNWQLLSEFLQGPSFRMVPPLTRAKLLHDAWNLLYANELNAGVALNMTKFLRHEQSHVGWEPFFTMVDHLGSRIAGTEAHAQFKAYTNKLIEAMYPGPCGSNQAREPSWKRHMRGFVHYTLCQAGYELCIKQAREEFKKWMDDPEPDIGIPVSSAFFCPVFQWGSDAEWNFGLERVLNFPRNNPERKASERTYLLKTLAGCASDPARIRRLLNLTMIQQNENFTEADIHLIVNMLTGSPPGYTTLFEMLENNWAAVKRSFADKPNLWTKIIQAAMGNFKQRSDLERARSLYQKHEDELGEAKTFMQNIFEDNEDEVHWSERNIPEVKRWLDENPPVLDEDIQNYWRTTLACPNGKSTAAAA